MIVDLEANDGDVIWQPDAATVAAARTAQFAGFIRGRGIDIGDAYEDLWRWSIAHPADYWRLFAEFAGIEMGGDLGGPVHTDAAMPHTRWFPGRTLNFARHMLDRRDGTALVFVPEGGEAEEISFEALRDDVGALASHLRQIGVQPGDRVVAVLPNTPEAVVALLAVASIGAVWSVCAPEFGPGAILTRFGQLEPRVVIAAPGYRLSGADRDRGAEMSEILSGLPTVEHVVWVTEHTETAAPTTAVPVSTWAEATSRPSPVVYAEVDFSHPLWVLFSSGTTGVPKGIVHGHGGALLEALQTLIFGGDVAPGERFFSVASTSWVVWNVLVSAMGAGAVPVLADGNPTFPTLGRVWQIAERTRASILGVGAGFIHACAKTDIQPNQEFDLSTLREVQVTGSPLSADAFRWAYRNVGDVWLVSMSGGTDIVGCFVGGAVTEPVRVGYIQAPALGVSVESWDASGEPTDGTGELVVTQPMPSMPLYFWGDDDGARYLSSYFDVYPGVWRHGDFIEISPRGIQILGRSDSTLNRNGIRLGSADLYAIVEALPEVGEALVVGAEIGAEDYFMPLFVALAPGAAEEQTRRAVISAIRKHLSARYVPDEFIVMPGIPHTRTGKKLEVPVKRLLQGERLEDVVDLGAVDDPQLMRAYAEVAHARRASLSRK